LLQQIRAKKEKSRKEAIAPVQHQLAPQALSQNSLGDIGALQSALSDMIGQASSVLGAGSPAEPVSALQARPTALQEDVVHLAPVQPAQKKMTLADIEK
jgi:hypothetical protein